MRGRVEALAGVMSSVSRSPMADSAGNKGEFSIEMKYASRDAVDFLTEI